MGKEKTRYIPFGVYEYEYMEAWLEDWARKGWILKSMYSCFATFEEAKPCEVRYRIVPNAAYQAEDEEIAFYEESGWHFAGASRGLNAFYCEDPSIPELFTDTKSFSKRARNYAIAAGIAVLMCGYLLWSNISNGRNLFWGEDGLLHTIHEMGAISFLSLSVLIALAVFVSFRSLIKYAWHAKRIACGQKIEGKGKFRRIAAVNRAWMSAALLCVVGLIVGWAMTAISFDDTPDVQNISHPAGIMQVDPEFSSAVDAVLTMRSEGNWPDSYDYRVTSKHTALFSEYREVYGEYSDSDINLDTGALQKHNDPAGTPVLSEEHYYFAIYAKARSEKIAERYLEENKQAVIKEERTDQSGIDERTISAENLDTAEYLHTYGIGYQYLLLRKGNVIEYICYLGPEKLENHANVIVEDLKD